MKPNTVTCLLFLFCVINLFFGCSQRKAAPLPELEQAEAVMFDRPDSALHILQRMPKPADKEQHALWCLLVTQATYKQMLPITSDSLIRIAYDYYKSTDDAQRKAMAALYMGEVNYQLYQAEEAQVFYLEAATEVEKTSDFKLGYLIMSGLGNLYLYRKLPNEAWDACQTAYSYAVKAAYKRYEMASLFYMARCCSLKKDFDKAILLYERAIELADNLNLRRFHYTIKGEMAGVYSLLKQYDKALALEKEAMGDTLRVAQSYYGMGINYLNLSRYDSAYYCLNKALNTSNIYTRKAAYVGLFHLCHQPQYQKYLFNVCDSLRFYEDSVQKLDKSKEVMAYQKKYDHQKLINKNQQLELDKANSTRLLLLFAIIALILLVLLVYFYQRRKVVIHEKEEELNCMALQLHENEKILNENDSCIADLKEQLAQKDATIEQQKEKENQLNAIRQENERLQKENIRLVGSLKDKDLSPEIEELKRIVGELQQSFRQGEDMFAFIQASCPSLAKLRRKPVYLSHAEIQELCSLADAIFPKFGSLVKGKTLDLKESEVILCYLIKLHFSVSEIAIFLGIASTSVSTAKLRTKKKIYAALDISSSNESLDQWLWKH